MIYDYMIRLADECTITETAASIRFVCLGFSDLRSLGKVLGGFPFLSLLAFGFLWSKVTLLFFCFFRILGFCTVLQDFCHKAWLAVLDGFRSVFLVWVATSNGRRTDVILVDRLHDTCTMAWIGSWICTGYYMGL
jgi:hypothetical protein